MHITKFECSGSSHVWLYPTNAHGDVYNNLHCAVSENTIVTLSFVLYLLNSARFVIPLSKRKTVDGIWFLVLIIYVYTADTCLNLLRCVQVYEPIKFKGNRRVSSLIHASQFCNIIRSTCRTNIMDAYQLHTLLWSEEECTSKSLGIIGVKNV